MNKRTTKPSRQTQTSVRPRPRVYLDSTVPSYYFDERPELITLIKVTQDWWTNESHAFDLWISPATLDELAAGEHPYQDKIMELVRPINVLDEVPEIAKIADHYIKEKLMPAKVGGDATHLAFASFYRFDYLLTWNCVHLANGNKRRHLEVINKRLKLPVPQILTPLELFEETI
jgi:hypothetical protein